MSGNPAGENGSGLQAWATSRIAAWSDLGPILDGLERKRDHTVTDTLRAIELYRALGRDLSIVRRTLPASRMTRALAQSYARLHAVIYRKPHNWRQRLRSLFQDEIPQVVRELRGQIQLVGLLFALSAGAGWWLVGTYPELIGLFASEEMINGVEGGRLWTEGILNVVPRRCSRSASSPITLRSASSRSASACSSAWAPSTSSRPTA